MICSQWMSMSQDTRSGHLLKIPVTGSAMHDTAVTDTTTDYRDTGWYTSHSAIVLFCHGFFHTSTLTPQWLDSFMVASALHQSCSFRRQGNAQSSENQRALPGQTKLCADGTQGVFRSYRFGAPSLTGPWHLHDDKWDLTLVSVRNKSLLVPHIDMQAVNVGVVGHFIGNPTENSTDRQANGWHTPITEIITDYQDGTAVTA